MLLKGHVRKGGWKDVMLLAAKCLPRDCCHIPQYMACVNGATLLMVARSWGHGLRSGGEGSERAAKQATELRGFGEEVVEVQAGHEVEEAV